MNIAEQLSPARRRRALRTTRTCPLEARLGPPIPRVDCSPDEIAAADLVVVCVDHPDLPYDDIAEHARLVLDTRGCLRDLQFEGEVL